MNILKNNHSKIWKNKKILCEFFLPKFFWRNEALGEKHVCAQTGENVRKCAHFWDVFAHKYSTHLRTMHMPVGGTNVLSVIPENLRLCTWYSVGSWLWSKRYKKVSSRGEKSRIQTGEK